MNLQKLAQPTLKQFKKARAISCIQEFYFGYVGISQGQNPKDYRAVNPKKICSSITHFSPSKQDGTLTHEYRQEIIKRTKFGRLITDCAAINSKGLFEQTPPGIWSRDQLESWAEVIKDVHKNTGEIFIQIGHPGRAALPNLINDEPMAPSQIKINEPKYVKPREMTDYDIKIVTNEFYQCAKRAKEAGFDGIELNAADGYLIDQFLKESSNQRNDIYGGNLKNRARLCIELLDILGDVVGPEKIGIYLSLRNGELDCNDKNIVESYLYILRKMEQFGIGYIRFIEGNERNGIKFDSLSNEIRKIYSGSIILKSEREADELDKMLSNKMVDMIDIGNKISY